MKHYVLTGLKKRAARSFYRDLRIENSRIRKIDLLISAVEKGVGVNLLGASKYQRGGGKGVYGDALKIYAVMGRSGLINNEFSQSPSFEMLGRRVDKDHCTMLYHTRTGKGLLDTDKEFAHYYKKVEDILKATI